MRGTFTTGVAATTPGDPTSCVGLHPGDPVVVYDIQGVTIGTGYIQEGDAVAGYKCAWSFVVPGVPSDRDSYVIEIGRFGRISLPRDQAESPVLFQK